MSNIDWRAYKQAMRERRQMERAKRLEEANPDGWEKHTKYHWYRFVDGHKLDFWPSTGKFMYKGRVYHWRNTLPAIVKQALPPEKYNPDAVEKWS